jgi:ABC-type sugar transport system permease subunit
VNLNHLALLALSVACVAILGGSALSRRLHWPLLFPALLFLALAMGAFVTVWLMVGFYFQDSNDQAVPWIENLGIAIGVLSVASGLACIYFFCAACIVTIRQRLHPKAPSQ